MKKFLIALGIVAAMLAAPILTAPAALAAPLTASTVAKAPAKLNLQVVPVVGGTLISWDKPRHAPKGLRYTITFQYEGSNLGIGYSSAVAKGANYFVVNKSTFGDLPLGKWLVSIRAHTAKQPYVAVGAKHFRLTAGCAPTAGAGQMHPMYCVLPQPA